jgi:hypothetical protein
LAIAFSTRDATVPGDREVFRKIALAQSLDQLNPNIEVVDADVAHIARLPNLKRLSLRADSPRLTDASLQTLAGMPRLEVLEIHNAPVTDAGLANLKGMRRLSSLLLGEARPFSAGDNMIAITGEGFTYLAGLPALTELEIHSAALTGDGLKHLASLKHLKRLKLKGGIITDDDLRYLAPLMDLESLEIVGSDIDGTGFRHLAGLSKVSRVCLEGPNVTDASIPFLAQLPALQSVMIYGTQVTASGLEGFRATPRLSEMGLFPAVTGDRKRLKQALPNCNVLNGGKLLCEGWKHRRPRTVAEAEWIHLGDRLDSQKLGVVRETRSAFPARLSILNRSAWPSNCLCPSIGTSPMRTANWGGSSTTCTIANASIRP